MVRVSLGTQLFLGRGQEGRRAGLGQSTVD